MRASFSFLVAWAAAFVSQVLGAAPTDSYTDADTMQSGYLPNHNMDPNIVDSPTFGILWKVPFNNLELFYAKPLVYTPLAGGNQILFLASSQNWIRTLDAKNGTVLNTRQVQTPFLQSDIGCTDIPNTIGIIGTPVIDPTTDIAYFYVKTYIPNYRIAGNTGVYNGVYYFYAVNVNTLQDIPGFPILLDGSVADNAPQKYFVGGVILQRPSLTQIGSVVYAGFGGHCDQYNYTGLVIGVDVNLKRIVTQWAVESGPLAPQTNVYSENGGGGEGGIWMSGFAMSTDGERLFVVTGNGDGHQNQGTPATGSSGCLTLGEAAINLGIGDGGTLSVTDYFQPYDYEDMDAGDEDFGSGGLALLDPTVFSGTGVAKMGVTAGKNGKIYVVNADNLGGYRLGPGQTDNVVQTIVTNKAVFGGSGSYPGEGGYIYSTPVGYPTYVYKLGFDNSGAPIFSQVAQTNESSTARVGVGIPVVTTYQGQAGTAILWMTDPDAGIRAWYAVPQANSNILKTINLPQIPGVNKFQRPAFGDTRLYTTDGSGNLYCLGSPVNLPLNCTSPINFGNVPLGSKSAPMTVTCTALIPITSIAGATVGDSHFKVLNSSLPTGPVAQGASFSFPVTWDLSNTSISNTPNASYGNVSPGIKSTPLTLLTVNGVAGYTTSLPIGLTGTEVSSTAFISVDPVEVAYAPIVVTPNQTNPTISSAFVISNLGLSNLIIDGYAWADDDIDDPDTLFTNVTTTDGVSDLGYGFTATNLPPPGSVITAGQSISVNTIFDPINGTGGYSSYLFVYSNGGSAYTILEGSASTAPIASFSISNGEGGWLPAGNLIMDFGSVAPGSSQSLQIRICNNGGSELLVTKSKPPNGIFHITDPTELHESQPIDIDTCAYGTVFFIPNTEEYNVPNTEYTNTWTLNTNDITFGVHIVQIQGTVVDTFVGPQNGSTYLYEYLGCWSDTDSQKRQLPDRIYAGNSNDNAYCTTQCWAAGYIFAGTQYQIECWCGNVAPEPSYQDVDDLYCTYGCAADGNDHCGGEPSYESIYYDTTRYNATTGVIFNGPNTQLVVNNYNYIGCYSEATTGRALSALQPQAPATGFTLELCEAACNGYTYFGMEYANQCFCGNAINAGSANQSTNDVSLNGCNMVCAGNGNQYCGGGNRLDMYMLNGSAPVTSSTVSSSGSPATSTPTPTPTGGPVTVQTVGNYYYLGCYVDNAGGQRALSALQNPEEGSGNTVEVCAAACKGYQLFGVEYSGECYCDNIIEGANGIAPGGNDPSANGCSMTCLGNSSEYCGGPNRLNVYTLSVTTTTVTSTSTGSPSTSGTLTSTSISSIGTSTSSSATVSATPTPITVQSLNGWTYIGCYTEATSVRALNGSINPEEGAGNTVEVCGAACKGWTYFGVEYSGECYCGNYFNAGSTIASGGSDPALNSCSMTCLGNSTEYCGGPNRLNAYSATTMTTSSTTSSIPITSTITSTISSTTTTQGPPGSTFSTPTITKSTTSSTSTSSPSPSISVTTTMTTSTTTTTSSTTSSAGTVIPTPGQKFANNWVYVGCANETNPRALSSAGYTNNTAMTVESCQAFCSNANYGLAGIEYAQECYCGNSLQQYSQVGFTGCNMACVGNSSEICGGSSRISVYNLTTFVPPAIVQKAGNYSFQGCYNELPNARLLSGPSYSNGTGMTVESCVNFCSSQSPAQPYAGVEYASQCFCGATLPSTATMAASNNTCSMTCSGNNKEYCGGPGLLDVYAKHS